MKTKYIFVAIATLAVLVALCTTVSAGPYGEGCPFCNFYNGTLENGGGIYFDIKGHYAGPGQTQTEIFEDVPDGREIVRFYGSIWLGSPSPGRVTEWSIGINGYTDFYNFTEPNELPFCDWDCPPEDGTGEHCSVSCTGCGVCFVTYNASPYVITGNNTITFWTDEQITNFALLVVYENESMPKMQYWIKEGEEYPGAPYTVGFTETANTGPIDLGNISSVEYLSYGFPHVVGELGGADGWGDNDLTLNGNPMDAPNITYNVGYADYGYRWTDIPPGYVTSPTNQFIYSEIGNERLMVPALMLYYSEEPIDLLPPYTEGHDPAPGATNVPHNTDIVVHVKDDGTGVDQSTIEMTVEGEPVAPVITGTAADYTVTYTPPVSFDCGQVVDVTVDAADLNETPNVMTTDSYSFTIAKAATPFMIYGWVNDSEGALLNDPNVNVTNLNTSEIYEVETNASFNYYQVITCSDNVSAGDVLHFTAIAETTKEFNYTVKVDDMNRGGFEQNITIEAVPYPDMVITDVNAYHYNTGCMPWFNMTNEVDVTVKNTGDENATEAFNVSVSIDDEYYAKQNVPGGLNVGESVTLTFSGWTPIGEDCFINCVCTDTCHDYTITGVADCDNDVEERYEENNATTISGEDGRACHNGYMADEPLENVEHGILRGRLNFTTGNGTYGGLYNVNEPRYTGYEITIPAGASLKLAKLNVYYTWHYETTCPQLKVGIANETTVLEDDIPLETSYNDMKCQKSTAQWRFPWGNYVYNMTEYITGNGTYTVSVERTGGSSVCLAASGIVYVYEDANEPTIEYWINEGADMLIGGRRGDGGYLAWWECITNATFPASTGTGDVAGATLGVVTPWGDSFTDDILLFNDIELGRGVYSGYGNTVDETIDGMSMYIGSTNAQVGVNMTDVTAQYVNESENMVSQADDGDNMMPSNAFLVVQYEEEVENYTIDGYIFKSDGAPQLDPKVNITNLVNGKEWAASIDGNFYNLTLTVGVDVNASETLQIVACEELPDHESNCNVTNHEPQNIPGQDTNVNLTLNHYCLNYYPDYPYYTKEQDNWSGPAVMQACIGHYYAPEYVPSQAVLNETGIANNTACNADLQYVDPMGMKETLNRNWMWPISRNYGLYSAANTTDGLNYMLHYTCFWQHLGPAPVPAYGDYTNWMVVRGIHTSENPYPQSAGSYDLYGFWINDPNDDTESIGENTYKTVDQWTDEYYLNLTGVRECDDYQYKYVGLFEPPEQPAREVRLVHARPRFTDAITPVMMQKPLMVYGVEQMALERAPEDDELLRIVKAAIDGVTEELIPYDKEFAAVFAKTTAGEPMLVTDDGGDYYVVSFNVPVVERLPVKKVPVEIERAEISGLNKLERVERVNAEVIIEPIPIEPIKVEKTLVVVIVDADEGSFMEASWVADPVKYLSVSKAEALKLVLGEIDITSASELSYLSSKPAIELVHRDASPYYPDWKVTVGSSVYFVNQQGELFDADADGDGYLISEGDCNDNDAAINPSATEVCDFKDNNCDGVIDEGCPTEPSVIDYRSEAGTAVWHSVNSVLVRDNACGYVDGSDGYAYITLDMGETRNSGTITVRSVISEYEADPHWGNTIVYGSADNSNWITLGTFDPPEGGGLTDRTVSFSGQQVRYVKVYLPIAECVVWWDIDSITW